MVHAFFMIDRHIVYDSDSGAYFELDSISYDVINLYINANGQRPSMELLNVLCESHQTTLSELEDICNDFDSIISEGTLFAEPLVYDYQHLYPDQPKIKAMCLHICHDCNLRCTYCFAGTGDYGTGHRLMLSSETGKAAIDFLIAASGNRRHLDIDFFGGEPLMNWPVVVDLTLYCNEQGPKHGKEIRLTITTNALLLDEEKTAFINQHMKNCVLSIDGRPEVHNRMRPGIGGKPSYEPISKRIKSFVEARQSEDSAFYEHYVRATFTRHNLDFSNDVVHMSEVLEANQISVEPVVAPADCDYSINESHLPKIFDEYEKLAAYLHKRRKTGKPVNFFHFNMDMSNGPCVYKRLKGCGVGAEYCAVTPEGDIYPCHQFVGEEQFKMGNVSSIYSILDENKKLLEGKDATDILDKETLQIFYDRLMPNRESCKTCFARYHCGGGCAANRFFSTGSLDEEYKVGCELAKKRLECSIWLSAASAES